MTYIYAWGEYLISKNKAEINEKCKWDGLKDKKAFVSWRKRN